MTKAVFLGVCVNPPGKDQVNAGEHGEYVLLELKGNTKDLEIQHLVYPVTGNPYFDTWYAIKGDLPPHVNQLLVRGGEGQPNVEGARQTVYTGDRRWRFNNAQGEHLRVVDKHGKVIAELIAPGTRCDILSVPPRVPGVIPSVPPIVRPSLPAAAAFGEVD
ncbi:hypothetical protein WDJ50_02435 [Deinococcus sp. VB142]|uniref:Uncharacterized protein n=1 Tax=Deinococcus sp. VB142 TaxID=3112952 RepID=A0AAU6Q3U2_9DEIO